MLAGSMNGIGSSVDAAASTRKSPSKRPSDQGFFEEPPVRDETGDGNDLLALRSNCGQASPGVNLNKRLNVHSSFPGFIRKRENDFDFQLSTRVCSKCC